VIWTPPPEYVERLHSAQVFEDWCAELLYRDGLPIGLRTSMEWQQKGESRAGVEIKHDLRFRQTGNLFIETEETSRPEVPMHPAGIYADDNAFLYLIGDYGRLWMFGRRLLQRAHRCGEYREVTTPTAKGFLLPARVADLRAEKIYTEDRIAALGMETPREAAE
jgi:hypothetical protein